MNLDNIDSYVVSILMITSTPGNVNVVGMRLHIFVTPY